jgi:hypothetical protein
MTVKCAQCTQFTDKGDAAIVKMAALGFWRCRLDVVGLFQPVHREVDCRTFQPATTGEVQRRRDWYRDYLNEHKKLKGTA